MRYLPDNNLSYPVLITLHDVSEQGSGFYLSYKETDLYLVTARHVLYENKKAKKEDPDNFVLKSEVLKNTEFIINEIDYVLRHFDSVKQYVSYVESFPTIATLSQDISTLNQLSRAYKELVTSEFAAHTGIDDVNELLKSQNKIDQQKSQINLSELAF